MEYGKYPLEPFGALGGFHRKSSPSIATVIGTVVGTFVGLTAVTMYHLGRMLLGWIIKIAGNGFGGFASGIKNALRK